MMKICTGDLRVGDRFTPDNGGTWYVVASLCLAVLDAPVVGNAQIKFYLVKGTNGECWWGKLTEVLVLDA